MGFLDGSTNNIIIDAALTDRGRQLLAKNDGSFEIVKFAFGDDEVDYSLIGKFGRSVGKEKIEKNTPIFEAQTSANIALKNKMFSLSNPLFASLPFLSTARSPTELNATTTTTTIELEQSLTSQTAIEPELREDMFFIKVNNRFLSVERGGLPTVDQHGFATYLLDSTGTVSGTNGSRIAFVLRRKSISNVSTFAAPGTTDTVKTIVNVTGLQTGVSQDIMITIKY